MAVKRKKQMKQKMAGENNFVSGAFAAFGKIMSVFCIAGLLIITNLPLLSAFEAHVINVTAEIVNDVPSIDPPGGEFCNGGSLEITLSATLINPDTSIIYTINDSDPDCFIPNGAVYTGIPFPLTYSATVKARVCHYRDGELLQSAIMSEHYDISEVYCEDKEKRCDALSIGYWQNHEGCPASSNWTNKINALSSELHGAFGSISGDNICYYLAPSNCPGGETVEGQLCRAKGKTLADLSNIVSNHLDINVIIFGADDGDSAFDNLGLTPFSTVREALLEVEYIILNSSDRDKLEDAAYVAERIYAFYEEENPDRPECIYSEDNSIALNEFLPNPIGDDSAPMPNGEWVELYNNTGINIDAGGWYLYDQYDSHKLKITASNTNTGGTVIVSGGFLVVYRNSNSDFSLNNDKDSVRLYDGYPVSSSHLIDEYVYDGRDHFSLTPTPGSPNVDDSSGGAGSQIPENKSFARIPDGTGEWVDPIPTPGTSNKLEIIETNNDSAYNGGIDANAIADTPAETINDDSIADADADAAEEENKNSGEEAAGEDDEEKIKNENSDNNGSGEENTGNGNDDDDTGDSAIDFGSVNADDNISAETKDGENLSEGESNSDIGINKENNEENEIVGSATIDPADDDGFASDSGDSNDGAISDDLSNNASSENQPEIEERDDYSNNADNEAAEDNNETDSGDQQSGAGGDEDVGGNNSESGDDLPIKSDDSAEIEFSLVS